MHRLEDKVEGCQGQEAETSAAPVLFSDRVIGENFPPFYPWCRCAYYIVVPDEQKWIDDYVAAHGGDPAVSAKDLAHAEEILRRFEAGEKLRQSNNSDILSAAEEKEVANVYSVGKINLDIYKCVTDNIVTDEVIITDVQIQHIKDRHPNDFERFSKYFSEIVSEPDYIFSGSKPDTAVILKEIVDGDERFQTILRLCTSKNPQGYKNSIITFMKIDEKRWKRYLRTKEILYKRE